MGDQSAIEWTDATWNPLVGCSRVSEGCRHCYAERVVLRVGSGKHKATHGGLVKRTDSGPRWTGEVRLIEGALELPLRWTRPRRIFVNSLSDLFHESVDDVWRNEIFTVMAMAPRHTFQVLTKRPEIMRRYLDNPVRPERIGQTMAKRMTGIFPQSVPEHLQPRWPLSNVWLGVSVEDQATAAARIPLLLQTPAAVRWCSYEPALGPVDFRAIRYTEDLAECRWDVLGREHWVENSESPSAYENDVPGLDWVVVGGESGPGARPFDLAWARQTIAQGRAAGVPVFMKQVGSCFVTSYYDDDYRMLYEDEGLDWPEPIDWDTHHGQPPMTSRVRIKLEDRKGGNPIEWPEDLRVREYPSTKGVTR